MKQIVNYFSIILCCHSIAFAQQSSNGLQALNQDSFSFYSDSTAGFDSLGIEFYDINKKGIKKFGLLDSIANDTLLRSIVKPYQFINSPYAKRQQIRRNLPTIKEIKERQKPQEPWKFWTILFVFAYIAFVRIMNPNNFRVFMLSVFNLKLSDKIWDNQRAFFGFVILQLFAIYLFIAALFINSELEERKLLWVSNYFVQFLVIFLD